jgi:hypothetical protein
MDRPVPTHDSCFPKLERESNYVSQEGPFVACGALDFAFSSDGCGMFRVIGLSDYSTRVVALSTGRNPRGELLLQWL